MNVKNILGSWFALPLLVVVLLATACARYPATPLFGPSSDSIIPIPTASTTPPDLSISGSKTIEPTSTFTYAPNPRSLSTPDPNKWIAYADVETNNIHLVSADGKQSHLVTDIAGDHICYYPNWSTDGSMLTFACYTAGNSDIYIADPNHNSIQRLTEHSAFETDPVWSPNGSRIAFITEIDFFNWAIDVITLETKEIRRIATGQWDEIGAVEISCSWSPDGNRIIYSEFFDAQIFLVDADGENHKKVSCDDLADSAWNPVWLPNGNTIAYEETRGIRLLELTTCYDRMAIAEYNLGSPDWSPNGEIVSALGSDGIYLNDLNNDNIWVILGDVTILQYTWAPDSQHIAFVADMDQDTMWSIYTVNIHSEETHKLIDFDPELFGGIDWQP